MTLKDQRRLAGIDEARPPRYSMHSAPSSDDYYAGMDGGEGERMAELSRIYGEMDLVDGALLAAEKAALAVKDVQAALDALDAALNDASSAFSGPEKRRIETLADTLSRVQADLTPFQKNALEAPLMATRNALKKEAADYE